MQPRYSHSFPLHKIIHDVDMCEENNLLKEVHADGAVVPGVYDCNGQEKTGEEETGRYYTEASEDHSPLGIGDLGLYTHTIEVAKISIIMRRAIERIANQESKEYSLNINIKNKITLLRFKMDTLVGLQPYRAGKLTRCILYLFHTYSYLKKQLKSIPQ